MSKKKKKLRIKPRKKVIKNIPENSDIQDEYFHKMYSIYENMLLIQIYIAGLKLSNMKSDDIEICYQEMLEEILKLQDIPHESLTQEHVDKLCEIQNKIHEIVPTFELSTSREDYIKEIGIKNPLRDILYSYIYRLKCDLVTPIRPLSDVIDDLKSFKVNSSFPEIIVEALRYSREETKANQFELIRQLKALGFENPEELISRAAYYPDEISKLSISQSPKLKNSEQH